jgi:hypothetical protein
MSLHLKNQSDVLVCGLDQFLGKATVQVDILQLRPWPLGIGSKRPPCASFIRFSAALTCLSVDIELLSRVCVDIPRTGVC